MFACDWGRISASVEAEVLASWNAGVARQAVVGFVDQTVTATSVPGLTGALLVVPAMAPRDITGDDVCVMPRELPRHTGVRT